MQDRPAARPLRGPGAWQGGWMCCQDDEVLDLPAEAIEAIAHYRHLRSVRGPDWGGDDVWFARLAGFPLINAVVARYSERHGGGTPGRRRRSAPRRGRSCSGGRGCACHRHRGSAGSGAGRWRPHATVHMVVDSAADTTLTVNGEPVAVHSGQVERILVTAGPTLTVGEHSRSGHRSAARGGPATRRRAGAPAGRSPTRSGTAWFPPGVAAQVGLPRPAVLPRPRRHRAGAGRRSHASPVDAASSTTRVVRTVTATAGATVDGHRRPAAPVRPGRRRLVRRRPARPPQLQRRPGDRRRPTRPGCSAARACT